MEILITIVAFMGVLGLVVVAHEFGHYATAKAFGIKVNEFGFGFPPRLLGVRKGETLYSINLIPLGGFVKLEGENDPTVPRSLASKGVGTRAIVLVAGVVMNVVLAIVLLAALFMFTVDDEVRTRVGGVAPASPAQLAGVQPGDRILQVTGIPLKAYDDLANLINANRGKEMEWLIQRDGEQQHLRVVPRVNPPPGEGATGITLQFLGVQRWTPTRPPWEAVALGAERTWSIVAAMKGYVSDWIIEGGEAPFASPIGIAHGTGEAAREWGPVFLIPIAALISIGLAIGNILPIPPLDGGRLFLVILEWLRRGKRLPPEKEGIVNLVGIMALIAFLVAVGYNDIMRIVEDGSLLR